MNEPVSATKEIWDLIKETQKSIKELSDSQKETGQQMKETGKRINSIVEDFDNPWGKLGENLVKGSLVQRLQEKGIKVERVITNVKNDSAEFDMVAVNGKEAVVVKNFKIWWPEFKDKTILGAMAFLIRANRQARFSGEGRFFYY